MYCTEQPEQTVVLLLLFSNFVLFHCFFGLHLSLSGVLVSDVLSVKQYPHDLFLKCLPESADILCTHPMFGPESGANSWKGLPFVFEVVRVDPQRKHVCDSFLDIWKREQCRMVHMSSFQHDAYAASTQFITHTTGMVSSMVQVLSFLLHVPTLAHLSVVFVMF